MGVVEQVHNGNWQESGGLTDKQVWVWQRVKWQGEGSCMGSEARLRGVGAAVLTIGIKGDKRI